MVREHSLQQLLGAGFSVEDAERALRVIPIATHNQRGRGTLLIGSEHEVQAEDLVRIVEASMSSETYDLLKRPDELFVVNKAHYNPRFVEDVVREMLQNVVDIYHSLPDDNFVMAKQINFESIHKHDAICRTERHIGRDPRRDLQGAARKPAYLAAGVVGELKSAARSLDGMRILQMRSASPDIKAAICFRVMRP